MTLFLYCLKLSQITPPPLFFHLNVTGSIKYTDQEVTGTCTDNLFKLYTEAALITFLFPVQFRYLSGKKNLTIPFPRTKAYVSGLFFFMEMRIFLTSICCFHSDIAIHFPRSLHKQYHIPGSQMYVFLVHLAEGLSFHHCFGTVIWKLYPFEQ
jgi:hypothetical protein